MEVYFDDLRIGHKHGPVIQGDDYYPFGLTFNSYQRENSVDQRWKFQGQEHIDDLGLNWDSFKWRNHQPDIGRFFNIDPLAEKYYYNSPYAFSENKVVAHIEIEGLESIGFNLLLTVAEHAAKIQAASGRLVSGKSGYIPQHVDLDPETRQIVKIASTVKDANTVGQESKALVKEVTKETAEGAKDMGDATQKAGIVISAVGLPEVGIPVAAFGSVLETGGTAVSVTLDLAEGDVENALWDTGALVLDRQASKVLKNITQSQEIGEQGRNILEANKEVVKEVAETIIDETKEKK